MSVRDTTAAASPGLIPPSLHTAAARCGTDSSDTGSQQSECYCHGQTGVSVIGSLVY